MKTYFQAISMAISLLAACLAVTGQTNPAPQPLPFTQDFGAASFATMPTGTAAWNGLSGATVATQALAEASAATADATVTARTTTTPTGGSFGYAPAANASYYVQSSSNATNGVNQLAAALNTTGCSSNIQVSYRLDTVSPNPITREIGVVFQSRVGNTGAWTTVAVASVNSGVPGLLANPTVNLPAATLNQAEVQLRWAVWRGATAGNSTGVTIDDLSAICAPTMAKIERYEGYNFAEGNLVRWQSSFETNNLGFQVYREENGKRVRVTPELVAGSALKFGAAALPSGDVYSWWDKNGAAKSVYWIEDIDLNGKTAWHGPIKVARAERGGELAAARNSLLLNQLRPTEATALHGGQVLPESLAAIAARQIVPGTDAWLRQLQLAAGAAVKIGVRQHGWYRVAASQLTAAGLPANADARNLQLYADGVQAPIIVRANDGNALGADGYIEFYGLGLDIAASETRAYWLIAGTEAGLRYGPPARIAPGPRGKIGVAGNNRNFSYTVGRDDRAIYVPGVNNGAAANYFSALFTNSSTASQRLQVARLDTTATALARVEVSLQGFTAGAHRVRVALNNHELGFVDFAAQETPTARFNVAQNLLTEGENTLSFNTGGAADVAGVISSRISYAHRFEADDNQLLLTPENAGPLSLNGFTQPSVRVFDLTDANRAFELTARVTPDAAGYTVTLNGPQTGRALLAVAESRYLAPASVTANQVSNWTAAQRAADFVILTPAAFRAAVAPLAAARNGQGLQTEVISVEDIYDEWNGGAPDVAALRNFLHWTRSNWATAPRYVLLAGDASYDPRNYLGFGAGDLVPTNSVETVEFETASDESLVDFDGDGIGEMALGRLPAKNEAQMQLMANRAANFAPFANGNVVFVADRPDGYDFAALNAAARAELPRGVEVSNINRQALGDVETRAQVINAINQGPAIVQYAGHGSVQVWTGAPLLNVADTRTLTNGARLPFFSLMTCLNGYYVDQTNESLAEALLTAPNGGGIAVWGSTGLTAPASQAMMDRELFRALYQTGAAPRLGDAVRQAKAATTDLSVRRTWVLFGDPTLRIR